MDLKRIKQIVNVFQYIFKVFSWRKKAKLNVVELLVIIFLNVLYWNLIISWVCGDFKLNAICTNWRMWLLHHQWYICLCYLNRVTIVYLLPNGLRKIPQNIRKLFKIDYYKDSFSSKMQNTHKNNRKPIPHRINN